MLHLQSVHKNKCKPSQVQKCRITICETCSVPSQAGVKFLCTRRQIFLHSVMIEEALSL